MNAPMAKKFPCLLEQDIYSLALVMWEICQRIDLAEETHVGLPPYERCFMNDVSENPTIEEMTNVVVEKKLRPEFSEKWVVNNQV